MSLARIIHLVDDSTEFRTSAQWWLTGAGYDVREYADPQQALESLSSLEPAQRRLSCLMLDVRMPGLSGLDLHDQLNDCGVTDRDTGMPVIYMSGHADVPLAVEAMRKGAITVLEKPLDSQSLECALNRAFALRSNDEGELAALNACDEYLKRLETLTRREHQVLEQVVGGKISKAIARELGIATKTVELHRSRMMVKMQAQSVVHLTRMVMAQQAVDAPAP
jgi:two-component system response regulator FixJ